MLLELDSSTRCWASRKRVAEDLVLTVGELDREVVLD
jgi:hypothetical protein